MSFYCLNDNCRQWSPVYTLGHGGLCPDCARTSNPPKLAYHLWATQRAAATSVATRHVQYGRTRVISPRCPTCGSTTEKLQRERGFTHEVVLLCWQCECFWEPPEVPDLGGDYSAPTSLGRRVDPNAA